MKKNIALLCALIISLSLSVTVFSAASEKASDTTTTTSRLGGILEGISGSGGSGIVEKLSGVIGGLSDGIGDSGGLGDLLGGLGSNTTGTTTNYNIYTINPVVTTTAPATAAPTDAAVTVTEPSTTEPGETVDYAATSVPYTKPVDVIKPGDTGDGVKWLQWVFIFTHYGLNDNGITGVYDDATVAVVKKLQQENGLTIDGIVNDEVINKAEVLYTQYKNNLTSTTEKPVSETQSTTAAAEKQSDTKVVLIIVAISLVWLLVVAVIVLLFVLKKKKNLKEIAKAGENAPEGDDNTAANNDTAVADKTVQYTEAEKKDDGISTSGDNTFSMSDLFAEAEENSKKKKK